jgi:hypothetical protein
MSKLATFAASIMVSTSDEPESNQLDLGPYTTNVSGLAGANTSSPGVFSEVPLAVGTDNYVAVPAFVKAYVYPMYFGLLPVMQTGGALSVAGDPNDVGVQVSSVNPSFIPVVGVNTYGGDDHSTLLANGIVSLYVFASQNTIIKAFWS